MSKRSTTQYSAREIADKLIGMHYDRVLEYLREIGKFPPICFAVLEGKQTEWKPHPEDKKNLIILCEGSDNIIYKAFIYRVPEGEKLT